MLKRIPKSDISVRPFKAYKKWSFDNTDDSIKLFEANISSSELSNEYPKNSIYGQLKAQFYNKHIDNPFLRFGTKSSNYSTGLGSERHLTDDAKILSIPQIYVGEGIKKGSVILNDNGTEYVDDSFGNLIGSSGDNLYFSLINFNDGINLAVFKDYLGNTYNINIAGFNFNNDTINGTYLGSPFTANIVSYSNTIFQGDEVFIMVVDSFDDVLVQEAGTDKIGNIFYNQGLIILTKEPINKLQSAWNLTFKSTKTIYEHEYLLIVEPSEFNISQNPSAIKEVGFEYGYITGSDGKIYKTITKTGARYIRKNLELENGQSLDFRYGSSVNPAVSGGFGDWDVMGSVDSTGSYLAPYITTIGLYDDDCDLVAVAKLPQPIKSEPDFPVNFIVRFDI